MLSTRPMHGAGMDSAAPASDATVIRAKWQSTIDMILKAASYAASDMKGAADYILELACRLYPHGLPEAGVAWKVVDAPPLESYKKFADLLFSKTRHRPVSSGWHTVGRGCAYLYLFGALSLAKFIIGDDFHMSYWIGDDLNRQEDGDGYMKKCKDGCKKAKDFMRIDPFVPRLDMAVVTTSPRWHFSRTLNIGKTHR